MLSIAYFSSYFVTSNADYSGGQAATVGSVLVTNLKTGFRKGDWDRVEVMFASALFHQNFFHLQLSSAFLGL